MRIAHVVSTFPPYRGGQGNIAREIAERTRANGHKVAVVTPRRIMNHESRIMGRDRPHHSLLTIHHSVPWLRFGNAAWCPTIARMLEAPHPDLVHFHWPFIGGLAPVLWWRQRSNPQENLSPFRTKRRKIDSSRRLVVQYHMDLVGEGWRGAVFAAYQRWALPRVLAIADRVVVSSLDYARHGALAPYAEQLGERLIEIPLGVDTERFAPPPHPPSPPLPEGGGEMVGFSPSQQRGSERGSATETREEGKRLIVLFVGGLDRAHAFKGLPVLLDAMKKVSDTVFLRVVGDGDLRSWYEERVRALGVADRVTFLGAVADAELPGIYRSADVLVLPSTVRSEAFGIVLLEAMASGIPVIASDLPGVRTVVAEGETGFLVPPGNAHALTERLRACAAASHRLRAMGAAARQRVEAVYAWDGIIEQWLQRYESVCGTG